MSRKALTTKCGGDHMLSTYTVLALYKDKCWKSGRALLSAIILLAAVPL